MFLNEGCERRWPRHATIPIPINPSISHPRPLRRKRPTTPFLQRIMGFVSFISHGHSARTRRSPVPHRPSREPTPILRGWRPPVNRMPSLEYHHFKVNTSPPPVITIDKQQRLSRQQASFPVEFNLVAVRPPIATPPVAVRCSARAGGQSVGYGYAASASVPLISIRPRLLKASNILFGAWRPVVGQAEAVLCCIRPGP